MSSVFLGREGGDFTCATGTLGGTPYIVERFFGAIDQRYGSVQGSLYTLPGDSFMAGQTTWGHDLVSEEAVSPIHELCVENAKDYLNRFADLPDDDEDLVKRAVIWNRIDGLKKYHPSLVDRAQGAMATGKYREKS